ERLAGADGKPGEVARLEAGLVGEVLQLEVGRRAGARDPERLALEVRRRLDRAVRRHEDRVAGREADLDDALDALALALQVDRVVVVAHRRVDLAGDESVRLLDARGRVDRVDVDARLVVVAELLRSEEHTSELQSRVDL